MADTLGNVSPSGAPVIPAIAAATQPVIELAQQPPPALLLAATLAAVVVGRGGNGALLLRTDYGTLALKTALSLPPGSRVNLKLMPGPPATVVLLHVEAPDAAAGGAVESLPQLPAGTLLSGLSGKPPLTTIVGETSGAEAPPAQLTLGSEIEATVAAPSPNAAAAPAAGTRLLLRVLLPVPGESEPATMPGTGPGAPARFPGTVEATPPEMAGKTVLDTPLGTLVLDRRLALPPGTVLELSPIATLPPGTAATPLGAATTVAARVLPPAPGEAAPTLPPGSQLELRVQVLADPSASAAADITGTVISATAAGTVVETSIGRLALALRLAVPRGTLLALQQLASLPPDMPADLPVAQRTIWPALEETLATLDRVLPELAMQLRGDLSPASGQELAGTLLFLMSALNNKVWPGAATAAALDTAGRSDLRLKLDGDVEELRRLAAPQSGEWRIYMLPLLDGTAVRPVRLYLRPRRSGAAPDEQSTRFVLEVEMSRLGAMQLDGLVRPQRFDLVLRSHRAIPAELRQEIAEVFHNATSAAGLAGDVAFATASHFAVAPLEALAGHVGVTA